MGRIIIILIFLSPSVFAQGNYNVFHVGGQAGIQDMAGKEILPPEYEAVGWTSGESDFQEDVIGYKKDGKWGLVSRSNEPITQPIYQQILPGNTELVVASKKGNFSGEEFFGIINVKGKLVIPFSYAGLQIAGNVVVAQKHEYNRRVFGLIGLDNEVKMPFLYSNIYPIRNDLFLVEKFGKVTLVNAQGRELITYPVDSISDGEKGYLVTWKRGKMGVVDPKGAEILPPEYKKVRFTDNSVEALSFSSWRFFEEEDKILSQMDYDEIKEVGQNVYITKTNDQYRLYNTETGKDSRSFDAIHQVAPGIFIVHSNHKFGMWSLDDAIVPIAYDSIYYSDGYIYAQTRGQEEQWALFDKYGVMKSTYPYQKLQLGTENRFAVRKNNKWGFLNRSGEEVITCVFDEVESFERGKARVRFHGEDGVINADGDWVVYPVPNTIQVVNDSLYLEVSRYQTQLKSFDDDLIYFTENPVEVGPYYLIETLDSVRTWRISFQGTIFDRSSSLYPDMDPILFQDSLFVVSREGKKGVVTSSGQVIVPFNNEDVKPGPDEFIAIKRDGFYGFVDMQNKLRVANRYEDVHPFHEGRAAVKIRGKWGFINKKEIIVAQPNYGYVGIFRNGVCDVEQDNYFGMINLKGKWVIQPTLDELKRIPGGNWITRKGNLYGLYSASGRMILQTKFQSIIPIDARRFIVERKGRQGVIDQDGVMLVGFNYNHLEYLAKKQMFVAKVDGQWTTAPIFP